MSDTTNHDVDDHQYEGSFDDTIDEATGHARRSAAADAQRATDRAGPESGARRR